MKFPLTAVLSHWFLDVVVHIPDLPLTPFGDFKVGMGLWNYKMITVLLESIIFFGGVYVYAKSTEAITSQGTSGLWIMPAFSFWPTLTTCSARHRKMIS